MLLGDSGRPRFQIVLALGERRTGKDHHTDDRTGEQTLRALYFVEAIAVCRSRRMLLLLVQRIGMSTSSYRDLRSICLCFSHAE